MELKSEEDLRREQLKPHQKKMVNSIGFDTEEPNKKSMSIKDRLK